MAKKPPKIRPQKKSADRHRPRFTQVNYFVYDLFHFPKKSVGILSIPAFFYFMLKNNYYKKLQKEKPPIFKVAILFRRAFTQMNNNTCIINLNRQFVNSLNQIFAIKLQF